MPKKLEPLCFKETDSFDPLVLTVTTPPVLALSKDKLVFSIDTDERGYQMGAAVLQMDPVGSRLTIDYWSMSMKKHEKSYSTPEEECMEVGWNL